MPFLFKSKAQRDGAARDLARLARLTDEEIFVETGLPLAEVWWVRNCAEALRQELEWERIRLLPLERRKAEITRKRTMLDAERRVVDQMQAEADAEAGALKH